MSEKIVRACMGGSLKLDAIIERHPDKPDQLKAVSLSPIPCPHDEVYTDAHGTCVVCGTKTNPNGIGLG